MWLMVEKIPLLLIAVAGSVMAVRSQADNIVTLESVPVAARIAGALISYVVYLGQFFWPVGLAPFYPRPESVPAWQVRTAFLVLAAVSVAALVLWRKQPAVLVGWLWYLGMLVPMIGLVPIGDHARADRYTYLPQIGLCIALVWGVRWGVQRLWNGWLARRWLYSVGCMLLVGFMTSAWQQTSYWQNSERLWTHALACTEKNPVAHNNLGKVLASRGQAEEAITHFRKALDIRSDFAEAHNNLANLLADRGQVEEAIAHYRKALKIKPDIADVHNNLGNALARRGNVDEAIVHYWKALQIEPDFALAHFNLGLALARRGRRREALDHFQKALVLASARNDRATADAIRAGIKFHQSAAPAGTAVNALHFPKTLAANMDRPLPRRMILSRVDRSNSGLRAKTR